MPDTAPSRQIGGMALANGLFVHDATHWAAAVQEPDGRIVVKTGQKARFARGPLGRIPVLRGILRLGEAFAVLPAVKRAMPEARFAIEDRTTLGALVASAGVAAIVRRKVKWPVADEAVGAAVGLAPMLIALRLSSAAIWHGVEHKSIAAYESGGKEGITRAAEFAKEHPRCGSNLVVPLLVTSGIANVSRQIMFRNGGPLSRGIASAAGIGLAVEMFAFCNRMPGHPVAKAVQGAGRTIQAVFATREPGPEQLKVGKAAMDALLEVGEPAAA